MTIYLDLIFLENIFMNSIIIYATSIILKKESKIFRIFLGSFIGAAYACIYYISSIKIYENIFLKTLLSFAIVYVVFNGKSLKIFLKELLIFYLTSFTLGGVSFALLYFISPKDIMFENGTLKGIYPLKMILVGGFIGFIIVVFSFKCIKSKFVNKDMFCKIKIEFNKKAIILNAILDTGNFLKEPITGKPVIIVEKNALKEIIPEDILENLQEIINGNKKINEEYFSKINLIPFSSVGKENGLLLGIKPDSVEIHYQEDQIDNKEVIVGIYEKKINNKYNALIGLNILN